MTSGSFRFDRFVLDPRDRQLLCDGVPVELNTRYLDALTLLVREQGKLVSKDRFLDEVWQGVPVTDEALTQCIRTLRRQLGDDATRPRFIETVVKHGYRFVAPVEAVEAVEAHPIRQPALPISEPFAAPWPRILWLGGAGTVGASLAGIIGGLIYGFGAASQPAANGMGAASVLVVLACLTVMIAVIGGAGVSFGIAAAGQLFKRPGWCVLGGTIGGMVVGAIVKLLSLDAFTLLFGQAPNGITGGPEGALIGGAVGLAVWLSGHINSLRLRIATAGVTGAVAGLLIPLLGGSGMAGSLVLLGSQFPNSRLKLDPMWRLFGETGFGPVSQMVTGALEGALFSSCIVAAMIMVRRSPS